MSLAGDYDGWIIDLDGVVWLGTEPLPGAAEAVRRLREHSGGLVFLTNDPRSSRHEFAERLTAIGIESGPDQVVTSGAALAATLAEHERGRRAYVIGSPALKREIAAAGIEVADPGSGESIDVVAVGGHDRFDYRELEGGLHALERGAAFYATNRDPTYPMPDGPRPGTGAILAALETAAGRRAVTVGKPSPQIFELARRRLGACRAVAVVGDSLASDIAGGRQAGLGTVLVLGGSTTPEELEMSSVQPDHVVASLAAIES